MGLHGIEIDWEAEEDARTLARSEEIKGDGTRLNKAQIAATRIKEEKQKEAERMALIANAKMSYDNSPDMGKENK